MKITIELPDTARLLSVTALATAENESLSATSWCLSPEDGKTLKFTLDGITLKAEEVTP